MPSTFHGVGRDDGRGATIYCKGKGAYLPWAPSESNGGGGQSNLFLCTVTVTVIPKTPRPVCLYAILHSSTRVRTAMACPCAATAAVWGRGGMDLLSRAAHTHVGGCSAVYLLPKILKILVLYFFLQAIQGPETRTEQRSCCKLASVAASSPSVLPNVDATCSSAFSLIVRARGEIVHAEMRSNYKIRVP